MSTNQPRGIRNNNPGNIRHGQPWEGRADIQPDPDYITFTAPEYGIRAMARLLRTYREVHGLRTIEGIIFRWAPPSDDNPTLDYVNFVESRVGVRPFLDLSFHDEQVALLIEAIIHFENGVQPYKRETILKGIRLERGE